MRVINKSLLEKLKRKNRGNTLLCQAIDRLIADFEGSLWSNQEEVISYRPDADQVHSDGFFFFDINAHRTMVLIEFYEEEITIVWAGTHKEYMRTFRNNKSTIEKWLRSKEWII